MKNPPAKTAKQPWPVPNAYGVCSARPKLTLTNGKGYARVYVLQIAESQWISSYDVQSGGVGVGDGGFSAPLDSRVLYPSHASAMRHALEAIAGSIGSATGRLIFSDGARKNWKRISDWVEQALEGG
jgi:hypothetical protein